ncbi:MAG TPA: hypothetical protein VNQ56_06205 [Pseudolabrys sp.]|nr:hypothetical protein [Pseudolabrys sp.]
MIKFAAGPLCDPTSFSGGESPPETAIDIAAAMKTAMPEIDKLIADLAVNDPHSVGEIARRLIVRGAGALATVEGNQKAADVLCGVAAMLRDDVAGEG